MHDRMSNFINIGAHGILSPRHHSDSWSQWFQSMAKNTIFFPVKYLIRTHMTQISLILLFPQDFMIQRANQNAHNLLCSLKTQRLWPNAVNVWVASNAPHETTRHHVASNAPRESTCHDPAHLAMAIQFSKHSTEPCKLSPHIFLHKLSATKFDSSTLLTPLPYRIGRGCLWAPKLATQHMPKSKKIKEKKKQCVSVM